MMSPDQEYAATSAPTLNASEQIVDPNVISGQGRVGRWSRDRTKIAVGWAMTGLIVVFLLMDASAKLAGLVPPESATLLGWTKASPSMTTLGGLLLAATLLYVWPRTAMLGAILITGYLGGAIAVQARVGSPLFSHTLFGVYLGVILWGGLWFRSASIRQILPLFR